MSFPADDLLSPFHDGELTTAERAVVEQQLAKSAQMRQELSEIGQTSSLIKGLPRLALPTEFPQQVLQGIEREMLIPSERAHAGANASASTSPASPRQRWIIGAAAVLTSAAGLLLLIQTVGDRPSMQLADSSPMAGDASLPKSLGKETPAAVRENNEIAETSRARTAVASTSMKADSTDADAPSLAGGRLAGPPGAMGGSSRSPVAAFSTPRRADGLANLFFDQHMLKTVEIGDVVEALQTLDDEIAVVRLTVVDRQEGLNQLQLLFANNRIAPEPTATAPEKSKADAIKSADRSKRDESSSAEQMMAVFVESNSQHLTAALQELSQTKLVQSLEVESPISLSELDVSGDKSFAKSEKPQTRAFKPTTENLNQRTLAETLNQARRSSILRDEAGSQTQNRKSGDQAAHLAKKSVSQTDAKNVPQSASRQLTLQVPADALPQQASQNLQSRTARPNFGQRSQNQGKQNVAAQNEQRPMQVLFVVVNQAGNAVKPTEPPADKKAAAPAKAKAKEAKTPEEGGAA